MTGDWLRVRELFELALEVPAARRADWLASQTVDEAGIRHQVERLLAAEAADDKFLEPPTLAQTATTTAQAQPMHLGPFRLLERIGSGGMGTVWLGEQAHPQRRVAVKVMNPGHVAERHRARFRVEIDVLARLQHPGIAQVYEAGVEADGVTWFAMELLQQALPITHSMPRGADLKEVLAAFLAVCSAVQHAHQRGVIHRDLKPANILRLPDGSVKVIDFGIARVLDGEQTDATRGGELLGTLAYMSPEQIEGLETDVRTDVYGLGVVLYELVCGRRPFDLDGLPITTACRTIVEREAPAVRSVVADLPAELEWIVGRALRKAPTDRYASVADFADDVRRLLHHEPVAAAPPSAIYRIRKFVRRHRVGVAAAGAILVVTLGAFVTTAIALVRTQDAEASERARREEAEQSNRRAQTALDFLLGVFEKVHPGKEGRDVKMVDALASTAATFDAELQASPTIRAALGRAIGLAFLSLGQLADADDRLRDSLTLHEQLYGPTHEKTALVLLDLGYLSLNRGRLQDAERLLLRADTITAALSTLDPLRIACVMRSSDLLRARGDRAAAATLLEPLVELLRRERAQDRDTLLATNLLGGIRLEQGEVLTALPLFQRVVDGFAARGESLHPEALSARNNLLMVQASRERRPELLPQLAQLIRDRQDVLGRSHPDTIGTLSNFGALQFRYGNRQEGLRVLREAVGSLGPRSKDTDHFVRTLISNLARIELDLGDPANAERLTLRALAARREALGDSHEETLMTIALLGEVYRKQERFDDALRELTAGHELAMAADPPQWPNRYRLLLGIARGKLAKGDLPAAEQALLQCRQMFEQAEAGNSSKGQLERVEPLLFDLYGAWQKPELQAHYAPTGNGK